MRAFRHVPQRGRMPDGCACRRTQWLRQPPLDPAFGNWRCSELRADSVVDARIEYARAVDNDDANQARVWGARALAQAFPDDSADGLRVDPHIFAPYPKNETAVLGFDTSIPVRTSHRDQARAALEKCTDWLNLVSYSGGEFASAEEFEASLGEGQELGVDDDIPSWVSEPDVRDDGVAIVFDSAWMRLPMMVTMINIVREELRSGRRHGRSDDVVLRLTQARHVPGALSVPHSATSSRAYGRGLRERLEAAGGSESVRLDAHRHVRPGREIGERDHRRQFHQGRVAELVPEPGSHLIGDPRRLYRHRLGVPEHLSLERREHGRLTPPRHLARLVHVEVEVVGLEAVEVQAPATAHLPATAMCANDSSCSSQTSHFFSSPPKPAMLISTFWLCQ